MNVRDWYVQEALQSVVRLNEVLANLTAPEVFACLELESGSRRRRSIIERLISRAVRINEVELSTKLKKQYLQHPAQ